MQLPSAPESEKFLLACAITFPDDLTNIVSELNIPDYFCGPGYREVYEALLQQVGEGMQPDLMTLHALGKGAEFNIRLAEITSIPDTMHTTFFLEANRKRAIETHARIVREAYIKRETQLALSRGEDAKAVLAQFSKLAASGKDRAFSASQIADLFYTQLEEQPDRIPFPYRLLNDATGGGIRRGELIVVGGRQGGGKSVFLQNIAYHVLEAGKRVLFVSAEMGSTDLAGRWVTMISKQQVLRQNKEIDQAKAMEAVGQVSAWGNRLMVHELVSVAGVEQALKDFPGQIDLVCVDYLQKLSAINPRAKSEYERVSEVSRTLDNLCQRYQVPMIVAAQFNRRAEGQQPTIADLRDSGQIEADADMVISLWQKPEEVKQGGQKIKIYIDVLKNRNGYQIHNGEGHEHALWFDKPNFTLYETDRRFDGVEVYGQSSE